VWPSISSIDVLNIYNLNGFRWSYRSQVTSYCWYMAAPFTLYFLVLSNRVISKRVESDHYIGDKLPSSSPNPSTSTDGCRDFDPLTLVSRCHANFLENVPLAFIFLTIAELNGGNRKWLNYTMGLLLALRIAHADAGLMVKGKWGDRGIGRPIGYVGTNGVLLGLSGYAAYLVKGYWGF